MVKSLATIQLADPCHNSSFNNQSSEHNESKRLKLPLEFLVELGVSLVDVVDVCVVIVGAASAVLGALLNPDNCK